MGIPDEILQKPGPLSDEEWSTMRRHPQYAYQMLSNIKYLKEAIIIPYYHHERWDGSGYPHKLKGSDIPLYARLFAVVDVWDALSSDRPYRKRIPRHDVVEYLKKESGRLFDPEIVEKFLLLLGESKIKQHGASMEAPCFILFIRHSHSPTPLELQPVSYTYSSSHRIPYTSQA